MADKRCRSCDLCGKSGWKREWLELPMVRKKVPSVFGCTYRLGGGVVVSGENIVRALSNYSVIYRKYKNTAKLKKANAHK